MRNAEVLCRHFKVFRELMVKTLDLVCNSREEICMIMTLIWNVNTLQNHFADLKHSVNVGDVISVSLSFPFILSHMGHARSLSTQP